MSDSAQERSEQPTAKRRNSARTEGRIARSPELSSAAVLLGGTLVLAMISARSFLSFHQEVVQEAMTALSFRDLGSGGAAGFVANLGQRLFATILPFTLGTAAVVLAVNLAQARGVMSLTPITPKFSHLDPMKGVKRLFGVEGLFNGFKAVLKLTAVGGLAWIMISRTMPEVVALAGADPITVAQVLGRILLRFSFLIGLAYLVVAAVDAVHQRHRHEKSLRMTHQEVRNEHKDSEGDPQLKGRIHAVARANARRRMLQQVSEADVVVVNPTHVAVALKYDTDLAAAPVVLAMGQRKLAQRIREIARDAGVPIVENIPVARALLATATVGQVIPPKLYAAVAEILAFVYRSRRGNAAPDTRLSGGRS